MFKKSKTMKNTAQHILGYIVGISIILLIPWWQYNLSIKEFVGFNDTLFNSTILRIAISIPIFLLGIVFGFWSNYVLFDYGKGGPVDIFNVPISPRSRNLLVSGPYKYCRNPMVFGAICIYTSIGLYLNSIRSLMVVCGFIVFMYMYVKIFEETRLLRDFGDAYRAYKEKVPMIIPMLKKKKKR